MRTLSVFEYGPVEGLTSLEKSTLEQLRGPSGEKMFQVGWRETKATSLVGVVQLPQTTLQVLPKMCRHDLDGRDGPPGRPFPENRISADLVLTRPGLTFPPQHPSLAA